LTNNQPGLSFLHASFEEDDYALRALFTLVDHYGGQPIPIRELARAMMPERFLEQIMLALKSQGWVDSSAGIRAVISWPEIRLKSRWASGPAF